MSVRQFLSKYRQSERILSFTAASIAVLAGLGFSEAARAARVLEVRDGATRVREAPIPRWALNVQQPAAGPGAAQVSDRVAAQSSGDPVRRALRRARARGRLSKTDYNRYSAIYSAALRARRALTGQRRSELGSVITATRRLARSKRLGGRMPIVFLNLKRNTEWWRKSGPPASGARLRFGNSKVIFQYFPSQGLQFHPLANFGQLNGYWYGKQTTNLRSLAEDLIDVRSMRGGFSTWEYLFSFGGGSPPWISGMAQGTAMQALARAGQRLHEPHFIEVARRARGAFETRTPSGVRHPSGSGAWYPLYSFDPRGNVLNGMLQAVNGLRTYAQIAEDDRAERLFRDGDRIARSVIRSYDTGAWSLYSRPGGRPGSEANLNYHKLNRDFARNLCKGTKADAYCEEADRFTKYLKQDPKLEPIRAVPSPAKAKHGVRFKFKLSKISKVAILVRLEGHTYYANSATLPHGLHYFRWVPPKFKKQKEYTFQLSARDLAGNGDTVQGSLRVRP